MLSPCAKLERSFPSAVLVALRASQEIRQYQKLGTLARVQVDDDLYLQLIQAYRNRNLVSKWHKVDESQVREMRVKRKVKR